MINLAILASGSGSNAQALMQFCQSEKNKAQVALVITNKPHAYVRERAGKFNIPCFYEEEEMKILQLLKEYKVEWVFLAGYMRLLSAQFLQNFYDEKIKRNKVVNIHPSLLPKFPGMNVYPRVYASTEVESGATVHFVDSGVDTGPILLQKKYQRIEGESLEEFKQRGLQNEHLLYIEALQKILTEYV
ncbi:MAG: phosphoribosylglycinamide formyltransferase [Bacteriovoracaceae bacterium]|nr:phosphoribosylglycinamide formyltransferase [Bacteriovoracaceae bacterium]